jgi:hypothetical protein
MHLQAIFGTKEDTIALFEYIQNEALLTPDIVTYGCLVSSYERHNDSNGCLSVFNKFTNDASGPAALPFTNDASGPAALPSSSPAAAPLSSRAPSFAPDSWICTLVLRCLIRSGRWEDAFQTLERSQWWGVSEGSSHGHARMKLPSSLCNAILYMHCFKANWENARLMLNKMNRKNQHVKIERETAELALKSCLHYLGSVVASDGNITHGRFVQDVLIVTEAFVMVLQRLRVGDDHERHNVVTDPKLYVHYEAMACMEGDPFAGKAGLISSIYFIGRNLYGFPAHPALLEKVCLLCISEGDTVQAKQMFYELALHSRREGLPPTLCNLMVSTLFSSGGDLEDAKHIFNRMRNGKYGQVQPDLQLYSCMIKHYAECGDTLLEQELFHEMMEGLSLTS